jgi:peptide chain release factor 2
MINFADIKNIISDYKKKVDQAIICIGVDDKKQQIAIINEQIQDETIWSDNTKMSKLMQEKSHLQKDIEMADEIIFFLKDCSELLQMAEEYQDNETAQQIYDDLLKWQQKINNFEITSLFKNAEDKMDCFIEINSGAGGTESQDWVQMLLRFGIRK